MDGEVVRASLVQAFYERFLVDQDTSAFVRKVAARYTSAALERVAIEGDRVARRAAVAALGYVADYASNAALGRALVDSDRGVRLLAENAIRAVWCRDGGEDERQRLANIIRLNVGRRHDEAVGLASDLIGHAAWFAEAWNQRAIGLYCQGRYVESVQDCQQALELNPYHFGAAAGMGQCYVQIGNQRAALESYRRALRLYPHLDGVRANVAMLERAFRRQRPT